MQSLNCSVLNLTVSILDFLYKGRDFQRFWVLEEIARAPYFAFLSVLHFRESLGLRGPEHIYLMKEHFEQTVNETEHLEFMESVGGNKYWIDRFFARHLVLLYYWSMVVYYMISPVNAYHLNVEVEIHAAQTYQKFLDNNPESEHKVRINEILMDEINHSVELFNAMQSVK